MLKNLLVRLVRRLRAPRSAITAAAPATEVRPDLAAHIVNRLGTEPFLLIDVGCSGGIHPRWRLVEPNLHAIGFDPNIQEISRLREAERNPNVEYVAGFVDIDPAHPFAKLAAGKDYWGRNPWQRLAVARAVELKAAQNAQASNEALTRENLWPQVRLADRAKPIVLSEFLKAREVRSADFIKIDVDGADFHILNSIDRALAELNVLGLLLEVNWFGTGELTDHAFYNTDRFMKQHGFELFDVTVRRYTLAALPGRFELPFPAQSIGPAGRPLQGDALYLRDLASAEFAELGARMTTEKIWKSALLFDIFDMPDCAAEVLITYADRLGGVVALEPLLDALADRQSALYGAHWGYEEYMRRFERQDPAFYPSQSAGG
jgi:hypothetical protein